MEQVSNNDILKLGEAIQEAKKSDVPFLAQTNDQLSVVGDVSKTEKKFNDYIIRFRFLKEELDALDSLPEGVKDVGSFYTIEVKYKNVSFDPKDNLKITYAFTSLLPIFQKITEEGEIEAKTANDIIGAFAQAPKEAMVALYNAVATILNIDDFLASHMLPLSVIATMNQIVENHPEMVNEADVLFG